MEYCVDIGLAQLNKEGEELCGDSVEVVSTASDHIVVVADGLGSGVKANILSRLTIKTAGTMLKMGGRIDDVMETLAHTLPICKVRKLAYSTFTILQVKRDGQAYLLEYENPPSFWGNRHNLHSLHTTERVIGDKTIRESYLSLQENDWLVIITDGVLYAGTGKTWNMGWGRDRVGEYLARSYAPDKSAAQWSAEIVRLCNNIYGGKPGDDASVAVVKVRRPRLVTVLIGPPRNKADDALVVDKLMRADGIKIVCGGTTGNMVGRVLGRNVRVDLSSRTERIPPVGIIPGIDLVTEGAITLVDALEHLKEQGELAGRDGASRLAAALLAADSVHFIVGMAANQAQHGEGMPSIYIYKQYIIRDLIRLLKESGKHVTEEYY
ncbi:SpoIIE family protein phosphatase [Desulfoscipio geothermicus]|uniref:Stage II sporulation protein E (SpoIIE) n=1 Tax=Desulfoscipio geothermicus DSM 3669 TaxID=1121426 RepID=A0A1I6D8C2_9FIRM|nr:SpoIIE family protein phosphatase [Desulfoscipio geothermicus]SFR01597.1 Stage II sporulation protein E (SpoIIE) [Desulfoscipio geothermicus DSM 3669]